MKGKVSLGFFVVVVVFFFSFLASFVKNDEVKTFT